MRKDKFKGFATHDQVVYKGAIKGRVVSVKRSFSLRNFGRWVAVVDFGRTVPHQAVRIETLEKI